MSIVNKRLENNVVTQHLTNYSWLEVFLLAAGLMQNNAMTLLLAIDQQARTYIAPYLKLKALIGWAEVNKIGPSMLHHRAASLTIAITIARASTRDRDRGKAIDSAIDSAIAIDSTIDNAIASARDSAITIASARDSARDKDSFKKIENAIDNAIKNAKNNNADSNGNHHFFRTEIFDSITTYLTRHKQALPQISDSPKAWRTWAEVLNLIWLDALELNQDTITLSREEAIAWKNYMYANELLIKCKRAAIRLSRTEWKNLEDRLLTLKNAESDNS